MEERRNQIMGLSKITDYDCLIYNYRNKNVAENLLITLIMHLAFLKKLKMVI